MCSVFGPVMQICIPPLSVCQFLYIDMAFGGKCEIGSIILVCAFNKFIIR